MTWVTPQKVAQANAMSRSSEKVICDLRLI
jgi:hypothetical protein